MDPVRRVPSGSGGHEDDREAVGSGRGCASGAESPGMAAGSRFPQMTLLTIVVALAIAVGVVGTLVPVLPGLWLIWAAVLVYGIAEGFGAVGFGIFIIISALAAAGTAAAVLLPQRAARGQGISRWGQALAAVLGIVGFLVIPIVGAAVGFVAGILIAALVQSRDFRAAARSTWSTLKGVAAVTGVQFLTALAMAALWAGWVLL